MNDSLNLSTTAKNLALDLDSAESDLSLLEKQDVPVQRYIDLLNSTRQLLQAQQALELTGGKPEYKTVKQNIAELTMIYDISLQAHDELIVLESSVSDNEVFLNDEILQNYLSNARHEYETERFELAIEEIDKAYVRMSELEAVQTKLRAAYDATSRNIKNFLYTIRYHLLIGAIILILMILFGRKQYRIYRLRKKIRTLDFRKTVISDLMKQAQKKYFEENSLSESVYHIRTKKYSELIRDINRQRPVLEEQLAMMNKNFLKRGVKK